MGFEEAADYSDLFPPTEWDALDLTDWDEPVLKHGPDHVAPHDVTILPREPEEGFTLECVTCGEVGGSKELDLAEVIARLHEAFVAVLADAWEMDE